MEILFDLGQFFFRFWTLLEQRNQDGVTGNSTPRGQTDKSVVVYVARSHRSRVGVSGRSLFFLTARLPRDSPAKSGLSGERWGSPPPIPPSSQATTCFEGLLEIASMSFGVGGWAESLSSHKLQQAMRSRAGHTTNTHTGHSAPRTRDVLYYLVRRPNTPTRSL